MTRERKLPVQPPGETSTSSHHSTSPLPNLLQAKTAIKFGSWNVHHGMKDPWHRRGLVERILKRGIFFAALQETDVCEAQDQVDGHMLYWSGAGTTGGSQHSYGLGFFVAREFAGNVLSVESVSNRICVLNLRMKAASDTKSDRILSLINVYAPTAWLVRNEPGQAESFYRDLELTVARVRNQSSFFLLLGDFNAKLGSSAGPGELFMGSYGKGKRNHSGELLSHLLSDQNLFAANTAFKKRMQYRTTWHGVVNGVLVRNQLDFICISQAYRSLLRNAEAHYDPACSDHALVVVSLDLNKFYAVSHQNGVRRESLKRKGHDVRKLQCGMTQHRFQVVVRSQIDEGLAGSTSPNCTQRYENLEKALHAAANQVLGPKPICRRDNLISDAWQNDDVLRQLVDKKRQLTSRLYDPTHGVLIEDPETVEKLRKRRLGLGKAIRKRVQWLRNRAYNEEATKLNACTESFRFFEVIRWLRISSSSKPFSLVTDISDGTQTVKASVYQPDKLADMVSTHYSKFFAPDGVDDIDPFAKEDKCNPLEVPVTADEVMDAMRRLRNGKACGLDELEAELFKYGGDKVAQELAETFNAQFTERTALPHLCEGLLVPLNKPGKEKTVQNTRPITLLTTSRKILSLVVLRRIQPLLASLSHTQCAYRAGRSTTEIIFSYRWIEACAQKYQKDFHILGIDMSKAFDSVDRCKLFEMLKRKCSRDVYRMVRLLLTRTFMKVKLFGKPRADFFKVIQGTFQGDGLSPALFIIYLETVLDVVGHSVFTSPKLTPSTFFFMIVKYADDVDFVSDQSAVIDVVKEVMPQTLADYGLKENQSKRENVVITPDIKHEPHMKKLGSYLHSTDDWENRKQLAMVAFSKLKNVWNAKGMKLYVKMRVFDACMATVALYNIAASALTWADLRRVDTLQRKLLRWLLHIHWPNRINNDKLYRICRSDPWSIRAINQRWRLTGHIYRQHSETPARKAMDHFFEVDHSRKRGCQATTIAQVLAKDVAAAFGDSVQFKTLDDSINFWSQAQDRDTWRDGVVGSVVIAYEEHLKHIRSLTLAKHQERKQAGVREHPVEHFGSHYLGSALTESVGLWHKVTGPERTARHAAMTAETPRTTAKKKHQEGEESAASAYVEKREETGGQKKRQRSDKDQTVEKQDSSAEDTVAKEEKKIKMQDAEQDTPLASMKKRKRDRTDGDEEFEDQDNHQRKRGRPESHHQKAQSLGDRKRKRRLFAWVGKGGVANPLKRRWNPEEPYEEADTKPGDPPPAAMSTSLDLSKSRGDGPASAAGKRRRIRGIYYDQDIWTT